MSTPEFFFKAANSLALLAWIALILSPPKARWTPRIWRIAGRFLPLAFSLVYLLMLAMYWRGDGGFNSIEQVRALFNQPGAVVAGWVHYLAFDLFVGVWIAQRSAQLQLPHWVVVPLLVLTFLLGPLGYLSFIALRAILKPQSLSY